MRGRSAVVILCAGVLALFLIGGGIAPVAAQGGGDEIREPAEPILIYDIYLDETGDARWTITARFPLHDEAESDAFDALASDYEREDAEEFLPVHPFVQVASEVGDQLDRPMSIHSVERDIRRTDQLGELEVSFTWSEFARADGVRVMVGDVFVATEHTWLATLSTGEYVRVHAPAGYTVESSGMPVDNRTMWMAGPIELSDEELTGTFIGPDGSDRTGAGIGALLLPLGAIIGVIAVFLGVGYLWGWWPERVSSALLAGVFRSAADDADPEIEAPDSPGAETDPLADRELLSDEELVISLIEHRGGRMRQASIVEETDWSNAKVSQLLSQMAEDGRVEKLRIGRENLINIPEDDPDT